MIWACVICLFSLYIYGERIFRLKHLTEDLYIGGNVKKPRFVKLKNSSLFSDEKSNIAGYVRVVVEDKKPKKVWRIRNDGKKLKFVRPTGDIYDSFEVEHLSRDKIIIKSAVNKKCLQYIPKHKKFALRQCKIGRDRRKQTFLITDENGDWKGEYSNAPELKAAEKGVFWGLCPSCIINGFGSEIQGKLFDIENGVDTPDMKKYSPEDIFQRAFNNIFQQLSNARVFRLKHATDNVFVGGPDFYPFFTTKASSSIFEDKASEKTPGKILIEVKNNSNKVWDIETSVINLIYYPEHGGPNQLFNVIHIAKDVVAIESSLGGCLQYFNEKKRFQLSRCVSENNYSGQLFLITDIDGIWHGWGSVSEGWGKAHEENINWGVCTMCIPGGFGSERQGPTDPSLREDFPRRKKSDTKRLTGSNDDSKSTVINPETTIFKTGGWYGAGGGGGGIALNLPGRTYKNNSSHFTQSILDLVKNSSSIGQTITGLIRTAGPPPPTGFLKKTGNLADFIMNFESYGTNRNIAKARETYLDSFGNVYNSEDHRLDIEFDDLPIYEKKSILENSTKATQRDKNSRYYIGHGYFPEFYTSLAQGFRNSFQTL